MYAVPSFRTSLSFGFHLVLAHHFHLFLCCFVFSAFLFLLMILADGRMLENGLKSKCAEVESCVCIANTERWVGNGTE